MLLVVIAVSFFCLLVQAVHVSKHRIPICNGGVSVRGRYIFPAVGTLAVRPVYILDSILDTSLYLAVCPLICFLLLGKGCRDECESSHLVIHLPESILRRRIKLLCAVKQRHVKSSLLYGLSYSVHRFLESFKDHLLVVKIRRMILCHSKHGHKFLLKLFIGYIQNLCICSRNSILASGILCII